MKIYLNRIQIILDSWGYIIILVMVISYYKNIEACDILRNLISTRIIEWMKLAQYTINVVLFSAYAMFHNFWGGYYGTDKSILQSYAN